MESGVPEELSECEYLVDAYNVLARHPGMGDFLAFQLLLDLSYSEVLARFNPSDFVVAGVGNLGTYVVDALLKLQKEGKVTSVSFLSRKVR